MQVTPNQAQEVQRADSFGTDANETLQDDSVYLKSYIAKLMEGSSVLEYAQEDMCTMSYQEGPIPVERFLQVEDGPLRNSDRQAEFNLAIFEATNEVLLEALSLGRSTTVWILTISGVLGHPNNLNFV